MDGDKKGSKTEDNGINSLVFKMVAPREEMDVGGIEEVFRYEDLQQEKVKDKKEEVVGMECVDREIEKADRGRGGGEKAGREREKEEEVRERHREEAANTAVIAAIADERLRLEKGEEERDQIILDGLEKGRKFRSEESISSKKQKMEKREKEERKSRSLSSILLRRRRK